MRSSLWQHRNFMRLWLGQSVSEFGATITQLALPVTAVVLLNATPLQMGLLGAMAMAPFLLVGLFAGVYVDRSRRRPLLVLADAGRLTLLVVLPIMALLHRLSMPILYAGDFVLGSLTVLFDVAYQSYLPALVTRQMLIEGNSKLEVSRAVANIGGPGFAGLLVQWMSAPMALLANAATYLVSVLSLLLIDTVEAAPERPAQRSVWAQIKEGLRTVVGHPMLRAIAGCTGTFNLFGSTSQAVFVLYVLHRVGLSPGLLGLVLGFGSGGALLGAVVAGRVARTLGQGRAIWVGAVGSALASALVPLASAPLAWGLVVLLTAQWLMAMGSTIYNVNQVALRQAITPDRLLGRMNASMRFVVWGVMPLGSLLGGVLGGAIGLRSTLIVAAVGGLLAPLWILRSPVRSLSEVATSAP